MAANRATVNHYMRDILQLQPQALRDTLLDDQGLHSWTAFEGLSFEDIKEICKKQC